MRRGLSALVTMDTIFLVFLALTAIVFLVQAYGLNPLAGNLPKIISWIMLVLVAYLLVGKVRDAFKPSQVAASTRSKSKTESEEPGVGRRIPWYVTFAAILLYPALLGIVGFPASTFVLLTGLSTLLGLKPLHGLIFGVLGTVALYALFVMQFQVPLPDGLILETIRGY